MTATATVVRGSAVVYTDFAQANESFRARSQASRGEIAMAYGRGVWLVGSLDSVAEVSGETPTDSTRAALAAGGMSRPEISAAMFDAGILPVG